MEVSQILFLGASSLQGIDSVVSTPKAAMMLGFLAQINIFNHVQAEVKRAWQWRTLEHFDS